jgi:hypothetical protein
VVEPAEPAFLPVTLLDPSVPVDELIPLALGTRPELAGNQALVQATLARLKQEKLRPLVPSLAVRSVSTNPSGTLGYGVFGGGRAPASCGTSTAGSTSTCSCCGSSRARAGQPGAGPRAPAEHELATLELFRTQDRIAAEVATAYAQVRAAAQRLNDAEPAIREATELVQRNVDGLGQTRRIGEALTLVVRPQESVAAVQTFAQANADFFAAVADYNRAQFRLYRALGHPAQHLAGSVGAPVAERRGPGCRRCKARRSPPRSPPSRRVGAARNARVGENDDRRPAAAGTDFADSRVGRRPGRAGFPTAGGGRGEAGCGARPAHREINRHSLLPVGG